MPCYYTGSAEGDRELAREEQAEKLAAKITELTRFLCAACQVIEAHKCDSGAGLPLPKGLDAWWNAHKKIDAKRRGK